MRQCICGFSTGSQGHSDTLKYVLVYVLVTVTKKSTVLLPGSTVLTKALLSDVIASSVHDCETLHLAVTVTGIENAIFAASRFARMV